MNITQLSNIPIELAYSSSCNDGKNIYVFGGYNGASNTNTLYQYNIANDAWTLLSNLSINGNNINLNNSAMSYDTTNNVIYVYGGSTSLETTNLYTKPTNTIYKFDLSNKSWSTVDNINISLINSTMICLNSNLYIIGGIDKFGDINNNIYQYDLTKNSLSIFNNFKVNLYNSNYKLIRQNQSDIEIYNFENQNIINIYSIDLTNNKIAKKELNTFNNIKLFKSSSEILILDNDGNYQSFNNGLKIINNFKFNEKIKNQNIIFNDSQTQEYINGINYIFGGLKDNNMSNILLEIQI